MSDLLSEKINFIFDCATSDARSLKCKIYNCDDDEFKALIEAIINTEKLTSCKDTIDLAQEFKAGLLNSPEGLWRDILRDNCTHLRTVLANIITSFVQDEILNVLCCQDEDV